MKHTPGPWRIADKEELKIAFKGDQPFGIWTDTDDDDLRICQVETETTTEEIFANAHLIASAPDLLQCLKVMAARLDLRAKDSYDYELIKRAFEIIDKAEGKES